MKKIYCRLFLLIILLIPIQFSWGQGVTTSSITGTVTDESRDGLPGATVVAVHIPTGTRYGTATLVDGRFTIPNMRVGGPYTVTVSFIGFQDQTVNNVTLRLAEPFVLNVKLGQAATQLNEVVVTGSNTRSVLNAERTGSTTNIGRQEVERLPTITRSLNDFLRLTPQASSTSTGAIGGGNYRQNNITVDGADFNNNFGIGGNLPANGSPISLDAIEEISVNVTPYDIRQSGFVGSSVNAVTRSGTNKFSGSAYTFYRNENLQGNRVENETFTKQNLDVKTFGFRLGGPIIKNKLFFFLNAEQGNTTSPGQQNIASTPNQPYGAAGTPSNVVRPTAADLDMIRNYLRETYNYETGPYQGYDFVSDRTTLTGRLDWNINTNNRFTIRYNQVESQSPNFVSNSRSPLPNYPFGSTARSSNLALPFSNANYFQESNFYSVAGELNSTVGKFANTLRGTFTNQNDPRSSNSAVFPFVDILQDGNPYTSFGYEPFTLGNLRQVKSYSLVDYLTFSTGIHNWTVGGQADLQSTTNGFQRFGTSYYTFSSWQDFVSGANPQDFALTYSLLPGYEQAFPRFRFAQYALFGQDEISLTDRFRLTAGLRLELPTYLDVKEIQTHPLVANLQFTGGERINTGILPKNRLMWSPRIGFNYDVKGDRSLQLRGGSGIFTGRVPTVWIVAQSGDAGLLQVTQTWSAPNLPFANMPFNPNPNAYRPETQPTPGAIIPSTISATDPNFRNPQTWKSSLALDVKLPLGLVGTFEGIYNKDLTVALGRNPNLVNPQPLNVAGYPDNRPIYPVRNTDKFLNPLINGLPVAPGVTPDPTPRNPNPDASAFNPVILYNRHQGHYYSLTAKLEKQFSSGVFASLAYVRSDSKVLFTGSGDQLLNTWSNTHIVNNSNDPELGYADYVVPNRVVGALSYRKEYLNHLGTTISLFFEGGNTGRFSYIYGGDFNRDGQNNDLIYIPNDASQITFTDFNYGTATSPNIVTAQQQKDLFFQYMEQDDYLREHKGQYAERNSAKLPWRNQVDFKLIQDIFINTGDNRNTLQFTWDVFNFGNFLNRNWGTYRLVNNSAILVPTNAAALTPGGTTTPTFRLATDRGQPITSTFRNNVSLTSTYYMQFGLRYIFN